MVEKKLGESRTFSADEKLFVGINQQLESANLSQDVNISNLMGNDSERRLWDMFDSFPMYVRSAEDIDINIIEKIANRHKFGQANYLLDQLAQIIVKTRSQGPVFFGVLVDSLRDEKVSTMCQQGSYRSVVTAEYLKQSGISIVDKPQDNSSFGNNQYGISAIEMDGYGGDLFQVRNGQIFLGDSVLPTTRLVFLIDSLDTRAKYYWNYFVDLMSEAKRTTGLPNFGVELVNTNEIVLEVTMMDIKEPTDKDVVDRALKVLSLAEQFQA